jgi:hypothetical protein
VGIVNHIPLLIAPELVIRFLGPVS